MTLPSYVIPALDSGHQWLTTTVTYGFWTSAPSYVSSAYYGDGYQFGAFTATMQTATQAVLDYVSSITNLTFSQVSNPNSNESSVQIGYGMNNTLLDAEAYTYYPDPSYGQGAGDVWATKYYFTHLNDLYNTPDPTASHVQTGDYDWMTIWHETGHALGLKHTFNDGSGDPPYYLPRNYDNDQYSIMSYSFSAHYTYTDSFGVKHTLYPETFMPYDIAAIQHIYGTNNSYNSGDDAYTLNPDHIYTIWDGGGTDTLDGSALTRNAIIDLQDGHYSTIVDSTNITQNVAIAFGTTIENAIGGSGNDTIYDNGANNSIDGGAGNDIIWLTTGTDTVTGGDGNDTFHPGHSDATFDGGNGVDTVIFTQASTYFFADGTGELDGDNTYFFQNVEFFKFTDGTFTSITDQVLAGTVLGETIKAGLGNDTISGDAGNDIIYGYSGQDIIDGGTGADKMYGGADDDYYYVDNTSDTTVEANTDLGGFDTVESSVSRTLSTGIEDLILTGLAIKGTGNGLDNDIYGNAQANVLSGSGGDDYIAGGAGADVMTGGSGADLFVFEAATAYGAVDRITDFKAVYGDALDLGDLLTAYDPLADALSDFVHVALIAGTTSSMVSVDADGLLNGANFQDVVILNAVTALPDVDTLVANGNLIV